MDRDVDAGGIEGVRHREMRRRAQPVEGPRDLVLIDLVEREPAVRRSRRHLRLGKAEALRRTEALAGEHLGRAHGLLRAVQLRFAAGYGVQPHHVERGHGLPPRGPQQAPLVIARGASLAQSILRDTVLM